MKKQPWTPSDIEFLTNNYRNLGYQECSRALNRTYDATRRFASALKLTSRTLTNDELDYLIRHYATASQKDLIENVHKNWGSIRKFAAKYHLTRSNKLALPKGSCLPLLQDTPEIYYWIGFLLADGHFSNKNRITCSLASRDKDHLNKLSNLLGSQIHPFEVKKNSYYRLSVMDTKNVNKIILKFDINSNKTHNPPKLDYFKTLPVNLFLSLFVGFIDGDGSITPRKSTKGTFLRIQVYKTWLEFLNYGIDVITSAAEISSPIARLNKRGYAMCNISKQKLINYIYLFAEQHNLPILARKWDKIQKYAKD